MSEIAPSDLPSDTASLVRFFQSNRFLEWEITDEMVVFAPPETLAAIRGLYDRIVSLSRASGIPVELSQYHDPMYRVTRYRLERLD